MAVAQRAEGEDAARAEEEEDGPGTVAGGADRTGDRDAQRREAEQPGGRGEPVGHRLDPAGGARQQRGGRADEDGEAAVARSLSTKVLQSPAITAW